MEKKPQNLNNNSHLVDSSSSITDAIDKVTNTYKFNPSILLIKRQLENVDPFSFKDVSISKLRELNSI